MAVVEAPPEDQRTRIDNLIRARFLAAWKWTPVAPFGMAFSPGSASHMYKPSTLFSGPVESFTRAQVYGSSAVVPGTGFVEVYVEEAAGRQLTTGSNDGASVVAGTERLSLYAFRIYCPATREDVRNHTAKLGDFVVKLFSGWTGIDPEGEFSLAISPDLLPRVSSLTDSSPVGDGDHGALKQVTVFVTFLADFTKTPVFGL